MEKNIATYNIRTEVEMSSVFIKFTLQDGKFYEIKMSLTDMVNFLRDLKTAVNRVLESAG